MYLHINSYYFTNGIHKNFKRSLKSKRSVDRYFVPVYKNAEKVFEDSDIQEVKIYDRYDKVFFFTKIFKSFLYLIKKGEIQSIKLVHAHTLISDGMIAYLLNLKYNTPYIITIRNTDLNFYLKNFVFRFIGKLILKNASKIICLSPSYKKKVEEIYPRLSFGKLIILPNGIDSFWLDHKIDPRVQEIGNKQIDLLFVGRIDENKNLKILIEFLKKSSSCSFNLNVVGRNHLNLDFSELNREINPKNRINYLGVISNKEELLEIFRRNHIFCMISYTETFGVTYLEAMSQGLPVLYTKDEGIDGYFDHNLVGKACFPDSVESVDEGISFILTNYNMLARNALKEINSFSWQNVMSTYFSLLK